MKIELSKEERDTLVELAYLGEWVVNAHKLEPEQRFTALAQKIYSAAAADASEAVIEYPIGSKKFAPSAELDRRLQKIADEYDEIGFWNELIERLAVRDMERSLGVEAVQKLSFDDYMDKEEAASLPYQAEFDEFGIDRLEISYTK